MIGLQNVFGHRAAHITQADKCNLHSHPLLMYVRSPSADTSTVNNTTYAVGVFFACGSAALHLLSFFIVFDLRLQSAKTKTLNQQVPCCRKHRRSWVGFAGPDP